MKKLLAASALAVALTASTAGASGYVQPEVAEVVIVQDAAASNQGIFVPIFTVILLLALHH